MSVPVWFLYGGVGCTLMATDLELGIRLEVLGIKVEEPGEALLPTGRLIAILREATDEELTIEAAPDKCVVRGQTNEFGVATQHCLVCGSAQGEDA